MRFLTEILAKAGITSNYVQLDTLAATPGGAPGRIVWNDVDGTLEFQMKGGNVTQQIGQELPVLVKHADNTGLTNGKVVYQFSSDGSNVTVKYASASSEATASKTFGVMTESATGGAKAFCTTFGYVRNINTSALTEGAMIWLSETPGEMTTTRPTQPAHGVVVGRCIRQHATEGVIFVSIQNGFELDELHDVLITSKANNDFIVYESATNLWKNKTISAVLGYTPANGANYLALTGGTLTGDLTLSGVNPRLYFTDTDNNPDYFISNTDGTFTVYDVTNSVGRFKIYSTGNAEFTNEITALSANLNGSTNAYLNLNAANAGGNEAGVYFKIGGTAKWEQYTAANDGNLSFWSNGNGIRFYITPTGGAAFASSITAGGFIYTTGNMFTGGNNTGIFLTNATNDYSWGLNRETAGLTLYAGSAAAPKVTINSGGNVIVGATGTIGFGSVKLLIKQSTNADYEGLVVQSVANSDSVTIAHTGTIGRIAVTYGSGGTGTFTDLAFATGGVDRLTIASTGASVFTSNVSATNFRVYNGSTTGGYLIPKAGWVGSGTDYAPSIAAETTYGINFFTNGSASLKMYLATTGQLQLNTYTTATSYSGTAAGYLAFDSSGNVITVAGVAATDNTKLPLTGGALTGPLSIAGTGTYLGDWGYNTLTLTDTGGYPGIFFKNGSNIWLMRRNGADNAMDWAYSTDASAQGTGTFTHKMRLASDQWWVSTYPNYKMRVVGGDVLEALNGTSATTLYLQYHSNTGGSVNISASKFIFASTGLATFNGSGIANSPNLRINTSSSASFVHTQENFAANLTAGQRAMIFIGKEGSTKNAGGYGYYWAGAGSNSNFLTMGHWGNDDIFRIYGDSSITMAGTLSMATSGTSYIRMGQFPQSVSNSGEAWIGRAADRSTGSMTVQLGGSSNGSFFEVVDYGWTTVTLRVGMNDFSYKGNAVIHAGNIGSQTVSNSAQLNGLSSTQLFNNMGNNHGAYANFNDVGGFGFRYVQGNTNGPGTGATQYYGVTVGLGNEYAWGTYGSQLYWNRVSTGGNPYLSVRFQEGGSWSSWSKIYAGYADSANYASTAGGAFGMGYDGNAISGMGPISNWDARPGVGYAGFGINWHTGVTISGYAGYGGVRLYASGYPTHAGSVLRLEASDSVKTYGILYNDSSVRSPIFYDSENTGYYGDFASTSRFNYIVPNKIKCVGNVNNEPRWDFSAYVVEAQHWYGNNSSQTMYIGEGGNPVDVRGYMFNSSGNFRIADTLYVDNHVDASYTYSRGWVYSNQNAGWHNDTYNQGLRQAKANVSYGNVITEGENYNGWSGYNTTNTYVTCFMQNSAGDHGFYQEGGGAGWTFFFNKGNHCAGIGTDNTWSGDGLRVVKQISAEYGFTTWSDRRAKENISPIFSALDKVLSMRGVYFNYIKDQAKTKRVGFIAQELQAVLPEVVNYAEEIDEYNVNYGQVVSLLTEGIKEQQSIIASQNSRIERLEALVEQLINK